MTPSWICHSELPIPSILVSEYRINLPYAFGKCKTGGFFNLSLTSLKAFSYASPHMNGLPFQVNSTISFNNLCKSGQNNDK